MMTRKIPVMTQEILKFLIKAQINELTESIIYSKLANISKDPKNKKTLLIISMQEKKHHDIWKSYTNVSVKPNNFRINFFVMIVKLF
jgi:rubrerythrin